MPTTTTAPFTGFPPEGIGFLRDLAHNNDTAWFDAHRSTYEQAVREPAKAFVASLGTVLRDRVASGVRAEPAVGRSLFRINRDTRFSRDLTPYHPHFDMVFWEGAHPRRSPAFLLRLTGTEVTTGAGIMGLSEERRHRFRDAVAATGSGTHLEAVLAKLARRIAGLEVTRPSRKRVPGGYPQDHPRAGLLKLDALHATVTELLPDTSTAEFVDWVAERHSAFAPLHRWLVDHLEDPT